MAQPTETTAPHRKHTPGRWLWTAAVLACFVVAGTLAGRWIATGLTPVTGRDATHDTDPGPVSNTPEVRDDDEPADAVSK